MAQVQWGPSRSKDAEGQTLYFAFGSNMNPDQLQRRCPCARLVGPSVLRHYRLRFVGASALWDGGGVATIVPQRGAEVCGVFWDLTDDDVAALDRCEGVPIAYQQRALKTSLGTALAYVAVPGAQESLPSPRYLATIAAAYRHFRFDLAPLYDAAGVEEERRP